MEQYWNIDWNEALSLGINEIDCEHQHFVLLINDLSRAVEDRVSLAEIQHKIHMLLDDWNRHAAHEEALLRQHCQDSGQHAQTHVAVSQQLNDIMAGLDDSSFGYEWISAGLRIRDILVEHLLHVDMKYRACDAENRPVPSVVRSAQNGAVAGA